jgi:hypothetical protein
VTSLGWTPRDCERPPYLKEPSMALPVLDPEARAAALEKAKAARQLRAQLKHMLKSGEVPLAELLEKAGDAPALAKMRVIEVLESLPNVGKITAVKLMDELGISPTRRLQGLGHRQREALLARFEDGK